MSSFKMQSYCEAIARDFGYRHRRETVVEMLRGQGLAREELARNGRNKVLCCLDTYVKLAAEMEMAHKEREAMAAGRPVVHSKTKKLHEQIERLTTERDHARRLHCYAVAGTMQGRAAEDVAKSLGWDCFKEQP